MHTSIRLFSALLISVSMPAFSNSLSLTSTDIAHGKHMNKQQEFNGFGCNGKDLSPHLKWSNAPTGTKSFAITAYDPDAPTGSGWWHWQVINVPPHISQLATNAGSAKDHKLPKGSIQIKNDYGVKGYGGACPPAGHGVHRYRFTVHALSVESIKLPTGASSALTGYMINSHTIEASTIESLYKRG